MTSGRNAIVPKRANERELRDIKNNEKKKEKKIDEQLNPFRKSWNWNIMISENRVQGEMWNR